MKENSLSYGQELFNQKKYSDALAFFLSLSSDSEEENIEIAYYLGLSYAKLSRYEDALVYLEQVVTSSDDKERVLQCRFILAVIYSISGRKRLASFELETLLEAHYKSELVYAVLAFISWEESDVEKCLGYYEKSLSENPDNITALNGIGYVLACEEKDLTRALSFCKRAVDFSPNSAACLDSLGWVYYKLGLFDEARKYLEKASAIDGSRIEIARHLRALSLVGENA